jgi:hypothetical protein
MAKKRLHEIAEEENKKYAREVRLTYDPAIVKESQENWDRYTASQKDLILEEMGKIGLAFAEAMKAGKSADDAEVQEITERWHQNLRNFYEPTLEILRGLGELYTTDSRFTANYDKVAQNLAFYVKDAIDHYVDDLETAEIEQMLQEDERVKKLSSK